MPVAAPPIITCPKWGALPPARHVTVVGRPDKCLVHHTDGHAPHIHRPDTGTEFGNGIAYAQMLQQDHLKRGWIDSGHSFLIMRSGLILQGRWGTVTAIEHGRMVESAHCPGQNDQPGVEFEHLPGEAPTKAQESAGIMLYAWIMDRCSIRPTNLYGHHDFYNTDCPDNLYALIRGWRLEIAKVINAAGRGSTTRSGYRRTLRAVRRETQRG